MPLRFEAHCQKAATESNYLEAPRRRNCEGALTSASHMRSTAWRNGPSRATRVGVAA